MKTSITFILVVILLSILTNLNAQKYHGAFLTKNYTPEDYSTDYDASTQNWDITQDDRGVMYFANTSCVLEYDGKYWRQILTPKLSLIRSVEKGNDGIVYVGSTDEFGYLAPDSSGLMQYVSLTDEMTDEEKDFSNVWDLKILGDSVIFGSRNAIFIYYNEKITRINHTFRFKYMNVVGSTLVLNSADKGLCYLKDTSIIKLPGTDTINNSSGYVDFAKINNNEFIIGTATLGLFRYNLSTYNLIKIETSAEEYIKDNGFFSINNFDNDKIIVSTINGGAVILKTNGEFVDIINTNRGIQHNCVYKSYVDNTGNIWLGLQNGISRIDYSTGYTFFEATQNINDFVLSYHNYNNKTYVGTLGGLFYLEEYTINSENDNHNFIEIENFENSCWDLINWKNSLIAIGGDGIFHIKNTKAELLVDIEEVMYCVASNEKFPNYIFIGLEKGFLIVELEQKNNSIQVVNHYKIDEITKKIRKITVDDKNNFWITTNYDGLIYMEFLSDNINDYKISNFGLDDGLPTLKNNYAYQIKDKIVIANIKGIYKAVFGNQISFEPDNILGQPFNRDSTAVANIIDLGNEKYYINAENKGFLTVKNDSIFWDTLLFMRVIDPYISKYDKKNNCYVYCGDHLGVLDSEKAKYKNSKFDVLFRKITIGKDSIIFNGTFFSKSEPNKYLISQPVKELPILNYKNNSLTFEYASNFIEAEDKNLYKYKLGGFDEEWSNFTTETKTVFTNIPEGKYTFKVVSKNVYGIESNVASYSFKILPPWYRTFLAYVLYTIIFIIIIFIIVKLYTRKLVKDKEKLEEVVKERTVEIREKNEELMQQKEEIQAQAEELEVTNQELEKLSIVASETDNAVFIFDEKLDLQWANDAFHKIYGYSLQEFTAVGNINLLKNSTNKKIETLVNKCIAENVSVVYETKNFTGAGKEIWVQTSLTPVFEYNRLKKLIAIESDITEIKKAQIEISQQNRFIKSSINYAKTIQNAILPISEKLNENLDNFIIFRPKDIVSGDFYWFSHIDNFCLIAAIDCTGHGVPGAFMSMIGNTLLNEIINKEQIYSPAEILTKLNIEVRKALKQDITDNQDGMDVCFTKIEKCENENIKVTFSGAKRPLFVFHTDQNKIKRYTGDRSSIGGISKNKIKYTNTEIIVQKGDLLFLSTDGYMDQNNAERKRFGTKQFMNIIEKKANLELSKIKDILETELDNWQGDEKQRDDITVICVKI